MKKEISGIYQIRNIDNGKVYIGSSKDVDKRWKQHIYSLNNKSHHSIKLQRAWDKYGQESFSFEIIEQCEEGKLLYLEQYYIDTNNSYKDGYNCKDKTINNTILEDKYSEITYIYKEHIERMMKLVSVYFTDRKTDKRIENNRFNEDTNECYFYMVILDFVIRNFDNISEYGVLIRNSELNKKTDMVEFDSNSKSMNFSVINFSKELVLDFK
ncbi:MAG: GIY-YIG nuclease family protein, partial [Peptostreptococcaceae bacterium]